MLGTPRTPNATKAMLLGCGELGKEVCIELQRLGVQVVAVDRYENAPAMQVAHSFHVVDMLDGEKLAEIKEQLKSTFQDYSKHIGIRNVNQRIKLIYGKEYGLDINSDENGTVVKIRIPKDKKIK